MDVQIEETGKEETGEGGTEEERSEKRRKSELEFVSVSFRSRDGCLADCCVEGEHEEVERINSGC